MKEDIVHRLRKASKWDKFHSGAQLKLDAAAEIERLRAALKRIANGYPYSGMAAWEIRTIALEAAGAPEQGAECDHIWRATEPNKGHCIRCGVRAPGQSADDK